jgi:hypothetical protein
MSRRVSEAWYRPLGLSLRLRTDHEAVRTAAEDAFRGFGPAEPAAAPDLDFVFLARKIGEGDLDADYGEDGEGGSEPREYVVRGDRVRLREGSSTLVVDRTRGEARGRLAPQLLAQTARLRVEFLELALQLMLPPRGFLGVHGAGVVRGGRAALLRAAGNGGKTTLAYAAARGRFLALAEDVVWMDVARKVWWGLPWWFHPRPDAGRLFPELAGLSPALVRNGTPKLAVRLEAVRPGSTVPRARPGPVVLLRRQSGETASRITAIGLPEASDLWRAGRAGTEEEFPRYWDYVEKLLSGNAWRLDLGDDLEAALGLIEGLLAG